MLGVVGVMVAVVTGRTEGIVGEEVATCGDRVLGLLVGRSVGLNVGFLVKLGLLVGTRDRAFVTLVDISECVACVLLNVENLLGFDAVICVG